MNQGTIAQETNNRVNSLRINIENVKRYLQEKLKPVASYQPGTQAGINALAIDHEAIVNNMPHVFSSLEREVLHFAGFVMNQNATLVDKVKQLEQTVQNQKKMISDIKSELVPVLNGMEKVQLVFAQNGDSFRSHLDVLEGTVAQPASTAVPVALDQVAPVNPAVQINPTAGPQVGVSSKSPLVGGTAIPEVNVPPIQLSPGFPGVKTLAGSSIVPPPPPPPQTFQPQQTFPTAAPTYTSTPQIAPRAPVQGAGVQSAAKPKTSAQPGIASKLAVFDNQPTAATNGGTVAATTIQSGGQTAPGSITPDNLPKFSPKTAEGVKLLTFDKDDVYPGPTTTSTSTIQPSAPTSTDYPTVSGSGVKAVQKGPSTVTITPTVQTVTDTANVPLKWK